MNIGFYLADIGPADGGIFQYSIYILKLLMKCDSIESIYVFLDKDKEVLYSNLLSNGKIIPITTKHPGRIKQLLKQVSDFYITRYYLREKVQPLYLNIYTLLNPDRHFLNHYKIDLLHVPRPHSPAYRLKYPVVITMHDLQHIHYPEFFTPTQRIHKAISYYKSIQESDHIIASFKHVKNDIVKYFKTEPDKISLCPVPLSSDWLSDEGTSSEELMIKYKIPQNFILTPSATWEHKNHIAVLEAIARLKKENFPVYWVATGQKTPFYKNIYKKIQDLGLEDQVIFTGVVSERDLRGFYNMAKLVVIPTLYEAGSGPLFEAMRYEVPVICSDVTSLPVTIGKKEFLFNPMNIVDLASHIKDGLSDPEFIKRNKENSRKQTEKLRNLDYESFFMNTYSKVLKIPRREKITV
jgi:glycosyltransferase involved in cell wall biosynthesis